MLLSLAVRFFAVVFHKLILNLTEVFVHFLLLYIIKIYRTGMNLLISLYVELHCHVETSYYSMGYLFNLFPCLFPWYNLIIFIIITSKHLPVFFKSFLCYFDKDLHVRHFQCQYPMCMAIASVLHFISLSVGVAVQDLH